MLILSTRVSDTQSPEVAFQKLFMVFEIRKGPREIRIWIMMNNNSQFLFLKWIFRRCVGGIIQSVQQRVRIRLLKKQRRSICHVTSDIKQSITRNRLVLHYSRSVKRCYGFQPIGATRCYALLSNIWGVFWKSIEQRLAGSFGKVWNVPVDLCYWLSEVHGPCYQVSRPLDWPHEYDCGRI